jgi:hypothetical protein
MKVTKQQLKQIIKEELEATLEEGYFEDEKEYEVECAAKHPNDERAQKDCVTQQLTALHYQMNP